MKLFLCLLSFVFVANMAKADTVDFYHVYHNELKIAEFNLFHIGDSSAIVSLGLDQIKDGDDLVVKYYRDFLDPKSSEIISVIDENGNVLIQSKRTGREHVLDLSELKKNSKRTGKKAFGIQHELTNRKEFTFICTLFHLEFNE